MKRSKLSYDEWKCIVSKEMYGKRIYTDFFEGYIGLIDMIAEQGIDVDGVPYFDDLYLDLVVYPNGEIKVDDMDELEEALLQKDITQEQFELAVNTASKLKEGLLSDIHSLIGYTKKCYEMIRGYLKLCRKDDTVS